MCAQVGNRGRASKRGMERQGIAANQSRDAPGVAGRSAGLWSATQHLFDPTRRQGKRQCHSQGRKRRVLRSKLSGDFDRKGTRRSTFDQKPSHNGFSQVVNLFRVPHQGTPLYPPPTHRRPQKCYSKRLDTETIAASV